MSESPTPSSQNRFFSIGYIVSALGGLALGLGIALLFFEMGSPPDPNPVVARLNGSPVRAAEAFKGMRNRIFEAEEQLYLLKKQAVTDYVEQQLLLEESQRKNQTPEQMLNQLVNPEKQTVDDKEVAAFLGAKGMSLTDTPEDKKEQVRQFLKIKKSYDERNAFVQRLKTKADIDIQVPLPTPPKVTVDTTGYPTWGSANAEVTIVEFSDFECPFCSRAHEHFKRIKEEYGPEKIRVVFRDLPLETHPRAVPAALAAHCAEEQGKFWEFHDLLFANQTQLENENFFEYAKQLDLNTEKFTQCYESRKYDGRIKRSVREADLLQLDGVPTYVINGVILQGSASYERFKERIDLALKQQG